MHKHVHKHIKSDAMCSGGHPVSSARNPVVFFFPKPWGLEWFMESKGNNRAIYVDNHKNRVMNMENTEIYTDTKSPWW